LIDSYIISMSDNDKKEVHQSTIDPREGAYELIRQKFSTLISYIRYKRT